MDTTSIILMITNLMLIGTLILQSKIMNTLSERIDIVHNRITLTCKANDLVDHWPSEARVDELIKQANADRNGVGLS